MSHDGDKALGQGVVDLSGEAAPLFQDAGPALLGGKLVAGLFELLDQGSALLTLADDRVNPERPEGPEDGPETPLEHHGDRRVRAVYQRTDGHHDRQGQRTQDSPAHREQIVDLPVEDEKQDEVGRMNVYEQEPQHDEGRHEEELERYPLLPSSSGK